MVSPGTTLGGRYQLDERIAGGGMGDVWRGTDAVLGRTVAIKILLPALLEEPGFAERFRGEARTMATINHPGVVDVYDYGSEAGTAFLVMEYVDGDALSRTLGRVGRLTPARTMALVAQAADALQAAHEKGIVHRDVKPGNLLVRPDGTLVLTDFGIARSAMVGQLTAAGSVLGTASYISPEQAAGRTASPLSDVYALGVVTYQCLAGRRPFEGDNPVEIAMRHVRDAPPPLPGDIPPVVRQFVDQALAKDPAARFASAAAMAQGARRASAALTGGGGAATTAPISGAPTRPISGAPTRPTSGAPTTGAGTRVMTGGMPQPGGPYVRGAAAVPSGPPTTGSPYRYGEPSGPTRIGGPGAAPPGGGPPDGRRGGNVGLWILLAILIILLVCLGGSWLVYQSHNSGGLGVGTVPSQTPTYEPTAAEPTYTRPARSTPTKNEPTVKAHDVGCDDLQGQDVDDAKHQLKDDHYDVRVVTDQPGGHKGRVAFISPCGEQPEGTEVTLRVFTGKGGDATPTPTQTCDLTDPNRLPYCLPGQ